MFSWTNLLNIWFLEPRFMEYKKYLSMWKLISDSCTLSLLYFFYRNCPSRYPHQQPISARVETEPVENSKIKCWASHKNTLADGSFFPLSHLIPIPFSCLHSVTKAIWDSQKNGVADPSRPLPTVLSSFSLIPYPFLSSVFTSSPRRFELPRKTVSSFFPLSHSLPVPLICFHFVTEAKQRTV